MMRNWCLKKMQTPEQKLKQLNKTIETLWHGVTETKDGDYPRIVNLYKEVLKINYKDRDAWENMIWLMWSLAVNNKDTAWLFEAEKYVKRYLSLLPNGYRSHEYIGQFYRTMYIDERLAVRHYESAIRYSDATPSTYHSLIALCIKIGDKVKARDYCVLALRRFKNDSYSQMRLKQLDAR